MICTEIKFDTNERYAKLLELRSKLKACSNDVDDFTVYTERRCFPEGNLMLNGHVEYPRVRDNNDGWSVPISFYIYVKERKGRMAIFSGRRDLYEKTIQRIQELIKLDDLEVAPLPMDVIRIA